MRKLILALCLLNLSVCFGQQSKYTISQDSKEKFTLTDNRTKTEVFSKCTSIEAVTGKFPYTDSSCKNFIVIRDKRKAILFDTKSDTIIFRSECDEITAKEVHDDNEKLAKTLPPKTVIEFELMKKDNKAYVLVNLKTSKIVCAGNFNMAKFNADRSLIEISDDWVRDFQRIQIRNLAGKIIIPFTAGKYLSEFGNGFIMRNDEPMFDERFGVKDKLGKTTVPFIYKSLSYAFGDFIIAQDTTEKFGVINSRNKIIIPFEYITYRYSFNRDDLFSKDGVFVLLKSFDEGDFVILDTNNRIVLPAGTYAKAEMISNEFCRYLHVTAKTKLTGIYDTKLRKELFTCEYKFYERGLLRYGFLEAEKNGRWGLLNLETGKIQIPFNYELSNARFIDRKNSQYFYLKKDGKQGTVALTGQELIPFIYDEIEEAARGFFVVKKNGLFGLVDGITFKEILPVEYSRIDSDLRLEKIEGSALKKGYFTKEGVIKWDN